jgi:hypothetical protein
MTASHGGAFQITSSRKAAAASTKSSTDSRRPAKNRNKPAATKPGNQLILQPDFLTYNWYEDWGPVTGDRDRCHNGQTGPGSIRAYPAHAPQGLGDNRHRNDLQTMQPCSIHSSGQVLHHQAEQV